MPNIAYPQSDFKSLFIWQILILFIY